MGLKDKLGVVKNILNKIKNIKADMLDAIIEKGGKITSLTPFINYAEAIRKIPSNDYEFPVYLYKIIYDKEFFIDYYDTFELNIKFKFIDEPINNNHTLFYFENKEPLNGNIKLEKSSGAADYNLDGKYVFTKNEVHAGDVIEINVKGDNPAYTAEYTVKINNQIYRHFSGYSRPYGTYTKLHLGGDLVRVIFDLPKCYLQINGIEVFRGQYKKDSEE